MPSDPPSTRVAPRRRISSESERLLSSTLALYGTPEWSLPVKTQPHHPVDDLTKPLSELYVDLEVRASTKHQTTQVRPANLKHKTKGIPASLDLHTEMLARARYLAFEVVRRHEGRPDRVHCWNAFMFVIQETEDV